MLDSLKHKIHDSVELALDTLQQYPITKGLLPSGIIAAPAFMDNVTAGLKILLLIISIVGAGLTAYAKWLHVKHLKNGGSIK